jgi:hypothetical protein
MERDPEERGTGRPRDNRIRKIKQRAARLHHGKATEDEAPTPLISIRKA